VSFADLGLSSRILEAVKEADYSTPTQIQKQAIPMILMGRDVLGISQTGTGKTASFTLPMIEILSGSQTRARMSRSLILEPTRELALQVADSFESYSKYHRLTTAKLIGGESLVDQRILLARGVDVLIATPGRLIDLLDRGYILLNNIKILVIDEADRMLDAGFIPDIERIVLMLPKIRQTLFFSATMAIEIRRLADAFLINPKEILIEIQSSTATTIEQFLVICKKQDKHKILSKLICIENVKTALIFCNCKCDIDILYSSLIKRGFNAIKLHGDMSQDIRVRTLELFKTGTIQLMICSNIAARGLDISNLSHVFNFDVPNHAEDYVHRIGRTGRAGKSGRSFTIATKEDEKSLSAIINLIGKEIPLITIDNLQELAISIKNDKHNHSNNINVSKKSYLGNDNTYKNEYTRTQENKSNNKHQENSYDHDSQSIDEITNHQQNDVIGFGNMLPNFLTHSVPLEKNVKKFYFRKKQNKSLN
jgi:superfamily II DNA/RNA helicase